MGRAGAVGPMLCRKHSTASAKVRPACVWMKSRTAALKRKLVPPWSRMKAPSAGLQRQPGWITVAKVKVSGMTAARLDLTANGMGFLSKAAATRSVSSGFDPVVGKPKARHMSKSSDLSQYHRLSSCPENSAFTAGRCDIEALPCCGLRSAYKALTSTLRHLITPLPHCKAMGPSASFPSSMSTVLTPFNTKVRRLPWAVIS
jgi:hypothetical protein